MQSMNIHTSFPSFQASDTNPLSPPVVFYQIFYTVEQTRLTRTSQVSALTTFLEINRVTTLLNYSIEVVAENEVGYSHHNPLIGMKVHLQNVYTLLKYRYCREALVSEPDPSCRGSRKGLGTILHSSCPQVGMLT